MRIWFTDFWGGFDPSNNYFTNLLYHSMSDELLVTNENPDIVFYSVFGDEHKRYDCKKVFFTGENKHPKLYECDLAFSFDKTEGKNYRLPLWVLYINWFNVNEMSNPSPVSLKNIQIPLNRRKNKFCNFIYNNPAKLSPRLDILRILSEMNVVDSLGSLYNSVGQPLGGNEFHKIEAMSHYKFSICCENSWGEGYNTEKLLHASVAGTIPIYWGGDTILEDFNPQRFIKWDSSSLNGQSYEDRVEWLKCQVNALDTNDVLYDTVVEQPIFKDNIIPERFMPTEIYKRIMEIV